MDSYHIATTKNSNHIPIMPLLLLETITSLIFRLKAFDFIVKKLDLHKNQIYCYKIEEKQKQLLFDTPARTLFYSIEFYTLLEIFIFCPNYHLNWLWHRPAAFLLMFRKLDRLASSDKNPLPKGSGHCSYHFHLPEMQHQGSPTLIRFPYFWCITDVIPSLIDQ